MKILSLLREQRARCSFFARRIATGAFVFCALLCSAVFARADIPEDYAAITAGLGGQTMTAHQTAGCIALYGKATFPVLLGSGSYQYSVCAAGRYNDSYDASAARAVAFSHTGWASTADNDGILLENALKWVSKKTSPADVMIAFDNNTSSAAAYFSGKGYRTKTISNSVTAADLSGVDVCLINMHSSYTAAAVTNIKSFTAGGGGLVMVATSWNLNAQMQIDAKAIMAPFGMIYFGTYSLDTSFAVSPVAYSPYYSALNATKALILEKEGNLTMTAAEKLAAGNAVRQVINVNSEMAAINADLEILSDAAHYGWIDVAPLKILRTDQSPVEALLARYQSAKFDNMAPENLFVHPSAAGYPGLPAAGGTPVTKTIAINGNTWPDKYMNHGDKPVRMETGLYAAPGAIITVTIPSGKTTAGLQVHIGGTQDNSFSITKWINFPKIWRRVDLNTEITRTGNVFGGLVTLLVPAGSNLGTFNVTVSGALEAPAFVLGETTDAQWNGTVKYNPGAWGYVKTDKMTIYVPRAQLLALSNPTEVATHWKTVMDTSDDIYGYTAWRRRGEAISPDRQVQYGSAYGGYPIELSWGASSETELNTTRINGNWGTYHELGHSYQDAFDGNFGIANSGEVDVNINPALLFELVHNHTAWDSAATMQNPDAETHPTYAGDKRTAARINFLARPAAEQTWANAHKDGFVYDFYFTLSDAFSWQVYKRFFTRLMNYLQDPTGSTDTELKAVSTAGGDSGLMRRNRFYLLMCDAAGRDLDLYFQTYGLGSVNGGAPISESVKAMVRVKNYPAWSGNTPIDSLSDPGALSVSEDVPAGTSIYQFTAVDADEPGTVWEYQITAGNEDGAFSIDKRTGILRVKNIDYERKPAYSLTVTVWDNGVPRQSKSVEFSVAILDAPEAPKMEATTLIVNTSQAADAVLGSFPALLEPGRTLVNYTITGGNSGDLFAIDALTGVLTLKHPEKLPPNTVIELAIKATDSAGATGTTTVTILSNVVQGVLEQRWAGTQVDAVAPPIAVNNYQRFESPQDVADGYARKVSGFLIPQKTGHYTFLGSWDDSGGLWLSTDETPEKKVSIAARYRGNSTTIDGFQYYSSDPVLLQAGKAYYIEAIQYKRPPEYYEGYGFYDSPDHIFVTWESADAGVPRQIIPGSVLVPGLADLTYASADAPTISIVRPASETFASTAGKLWCRAQFANAAEPSSTGVLWEKLSGPGDVNFATPYSLETEAAFTLPGTYVLRCAATNGELIGQDRVTVHVNAPSPNFTGINIGDTFAVGNTSTAGSTVTLNGGGSDIVLSYGSPVPATKDSVYFSNQILRGNGSITAHITGLHQVNNLAKAGVMIRAGYEPTAATVAAILKENGESQMETRTVAGSTAMTATGTANQGTWLRITRAGDIFTTERSQDGTAWTTIGTQTVSMPTNALIGLAVFSNTADLSAITLPTAAFDNVSVNFPDFTGNAAPIVAINNIAGDITGVTAVLTGNATDDTTPPTALHYEWKQVTGPDAVITNAASAAATVQFRQNGTYTFRLIADDGTAAGTNTITVTVTGVPGYTDWQNGYAWANPGDELPDANPAHDGLSNLVKYAFGMNPLSNDSGERAFLPQMTRAAGVPVFSYTRNITLTDITYVVETSTDLKNWTTVTTGIVEEPSDPDSPFRTYHVLMNESEKSRFFRVRVVKN